MRKTRTTFSENTYVFFSGTNPDIDRHWPTALFSASYLCGKKKHMNKLACIGLITLSVLSCSVSRDSKQRLYKQEKDSISAIRIDHLFHKAGSDSQNHLSATLRQVTLSIPDSTGRQYPLSVTTATLRQRSRRSATDTSSRSSARHRHTRIAKEQGAKKTGGSLVVMASTGPCPHRDFKKNDLNKIKTHL